MDVVGTFNCEYRTAGDAGDAGDAGAPGPVELEHELRSHFVPALGAGLELALGSDPAVYAIRRVDCDLTLRSEGCGLPELARRAAGAVTNAILRALGEARTAEGGVSFPGDDVVTFADGAEYIAQFVIDLLEDRAHDCWYYASFGETLGGVRSEVLASVLAAGGSASMRALGRIFARGYFERLLRELPAPARMALSGVNAGAGDDVLRPMLNSALTLAREAIAPGIDSERLLPEYAASAPPLVDWRDRCSLADGVLHALGFLVRSGRIRMETDTAPARIRAAAARLDWVDPARLSAGIERLLGDLAADTTWPAEPARHVPSPRPARHAPAAEPTRQHLPRPSSRQRLILHDLAAACASGWPRLELRRGDCAENRLRLQAALTSYSERWADDPVAGALIGAMLRELAESTSGEGGPLLRELAALGAGGPEAALARSARRTPAASRRRQFDDGAAAPADLRYAETAIAPEDGTYSDAAGVALLIRAALDLRLPVLASGADFIPGRAALVAALMALAGAGSHEADPALSLILGAQVPCTAASPDDSPRRAFEGKLLHALAARGLLDGDPRVAVTDIGGVAALIGGIERPGMWPLTQVVCDAGAVEPTLERWRAQWSQAIEVSEPSFAPVDEVGRLERAVAPLVDQRDGPPPSELTMLATGLVLVRAWGRWLPGLGGSSLTYLLDRFVRRPGTVRREGDEVRVMLQRRELDAVLELSGALDPIDARGALGVAIHFELTAP